MVITWVVEKKKEFYLCSKCSKHFFIGLNICKTCVSHLAMLHFMKVYTFRNYVLQIVLPLLLQDKLNLVENYVYQNRTQQMALVKLLDHLCDQDTNITDIIRRV